MQFLPPDLVGYLVKFIQYNDWNSLLRTSKTVNRKFRQVLRHNRYKKLGLLFFKGLKGETSNLCDISLKDTVLRLKMIYIKKIFPDWKGRRGEINLLVWLRFIHAGRQLEDNYFLEQYQHLGNYSTIHVVGTYGHKANPLEKDLNIHFDYDIYNHFFHPY